MTSAIFIDCNQILFISQDLSDAGTNRQTSKPLTIHVTFQNQQSDIHCD